MFINNPLPIFTNYQDGDNKKSNESLVL